MSYFNKAIARTLARSDAEEQIDAEERAAAYARQQEDKT